MDNQILHGLKSIAEYLQIDRQTLWRWLKSESPPPVIKKHRTCYAFMEELNEWLKRKEEK